MASAKLIQIDYDHDIDYLITPTNVIGATTDLTLRTVTTHTDANTKYVRKFGTDYLITQVTDIEDPIDANMTFTVKALDGTVLGSRVGGGAFSAGATVTAQGCKLEVSASGGAVTVLTGITIDTDVDAGGLAFVCAAESVADGDTLTLYLSDTTSTYYDEDYKYGGDRHVPTGVERLPYFHPETADAALGGAHTIVTVLDSATYEIEAYSISAANTVWQSALGETPNLTNGIGARTSRDVFHDGNNTDTIYVSTTGDDGTGTGTYQNPYLTIQYSHDNLAGRAYINIMDSGTFDETYTISNNVDTEPLYGIVPTLKNVIINNANQIDIYGFDITSNVVSHLVAITYSVSVGKVKDCSIHGALADGVHYTAGTGIWIEKCKIYDNVRYGIYHNAVTFVVRKCKINNNGSDGFHFNNGALDPAGAIDDSLIHDNSGSGINITCASWQITWLKNCTIINNTQNGILTSVTGFTRDIESCIVKENGDGVTYFDLKDTGAPNMEAFNVTYGTVSGTAMLAGSNTDDPLFSDIANKRYGLTLNSTSLKSARAGGVDRGANLYNIILGANDITMNGFIFDGGSIYNNVITELSTRTGYILQWCSIRNYNGKSIDLYATGDTSAIVNNCNIRNNGDGISFTYGNNTIDESIFSNNLQAGIYADYTVQAFEHCTIFLNSYGVYLDSNSVAVTIKNDITRLNSTNGIFSEVPILPTYTCISDSVTSNVTISSANNVSSNPLFVNEELDTEDLHLKTLARNDHKESPCLNAADDGYDMGAYLETRAISDEARKKYVFDTNPRNLDIEQIMKGAVNTENALGSLFIFAKDYKKVLPMVWAKNSRMSDEQWRKMRYFASLIPNRFNNKTREELLLRISLLPSTGLDSGSGVLSGLTLTDATKDLVEDTRRGLWVTVKYLEFSGTVDAANKTIEVAGAAFTDGQWDGYYVKVDGYDLLVTDTLGGDDLYFSDPLGILTDGAITTYVLDHYRINGNDETALTLLDPKSSIIAGTYNYLISFFECMVRSKKFQPKQPTYDITRERSKTGFAVEFEES